MTSTPSNSAAPDAAHGLIRPGDRIDKYDIIEQIGAGGSSVVWKGHDRLLERPVAIKQFAPDLLEREGDSLRQVFRREARLQKEVAADHKHLVRILDTIDDERGLFIVMEYVEGQSLDQQLNSDGSPFDVRRALGIVAATAVALEHIHRAGIIHRDLKPSNILLPDAGGLKVVDFGLAAMASDQDTLATGTVRYMAPELFNAGAGDKRADIYSLGMIAYEMLAGRTAFEDAFKVVLRDQRNQALRWMKWHCNTRATAPPLVSLNPNVSQTLSDLVARMMEKDRVQRVDSAEELIAAIKRHFAPHGDAAGSTVAAGASTPASMPVGDSTPTAALPPRSRTPLILGAMFAVIVLVVLGVVLNGVRQQNLERRNTLTDLDTQIQAAHQHYDDGNFVTARDMFRNVAKQAKDDGVDPIAKEAIAYAHMSIGRVAEAEGDFVAARDSFKSADEMGLVKDNEANAAYRDVLTKAYVLEQVSVIEGHIANKQFADAEKLIIDALDTSGLNAEEKNRLNTLRAKIADARIEARIDAIIAHADEQVKAGDIDSAINYLADEYLNFQNERIDNKRNALVTRKRFDAAMARHDEAKATNNLPAAVAALQEALSHIPTKETKQAIAELKAEIAYRKGRQAEAAGDFALASRHYAEAMEHNPAAKDALTQIKLSQERTKLVLEGQAALASEDYKLAITRLEAALNVTTDDGDVGEIRRSRDEAIVGMHVSEGDRLLSQNKLESAQEAFEEALKVDPEHRRAASGLAEARRRIAYREALAEGDRLRDAGEYGDSKRAYRRARDITETRDVLERLQQTEYLLLVQQAKAQIAQESWRSARGLLKSAARIRDTEEVRQLLAEIARKAPPEEE